MAQRSVTQVTQKQIFFSAFFFKFRAEVLKLRFKITFSDIYNSLIWETQPHTQDNETALIEDRHSVMEDSHLCLVCFYTDVANEFSACFPNDLFPSRTKS